MWRAAVPLTRVYWQTHSSSAVDTPPLLSAPPVFGHGRTSPTPREVLIRPSALRSWQVLYSNGGLRYCPLGSFVPSALQRVPPISRPTLTTDPLLLSASSRFDAQAEPSRSTVVREGFRPRPLGAE